ncbi:MAG: general secretion pathway protein I [Verrucomicrobia bacterium]|nr:MAG: general secretion pathway protein I [Verrucomicrobiota bacterium]
MPLLRQGFVGQVHIRQDYGGHGRDFRRRSVERGHGGQDGVASRGFTLLAVVVALAIFALSAVVLGSAYVNVLNAYETVARGNQSDEDVRFARAQLLAEPDHDKAEKGGDFVSPDGRQVRWHATIATTTTADLFTVTFVCELPDPAGSGRQTVTEIFTVLRPTWADPTENTKLKQDAQDRIAKLQGKDKSQ